jgi:hypothetical protein
MRHALTATRLFSIQNQLPERVSESDVCTTGSRMFGSVLASEFRSAGMSKVEVEDLLLGAGLDAEDLQGLFADIDFGA